MHALLLCSCSFRWRTGSNACGVQASHQDVLQVRDLIETAQDLSSTDPYVVANVLLRHFREMPKPLLGFELYDKWVDALGAACRQLEWHD